MFIKKRVVSSKILAEQIQLPRTTIKKTQMFTQKTFFRRYCGTALAKPLTMVIISFGRLRRTVAVIPPVLARISQETASKGSF